ncbi:DUF6327 family protein [Nonlabens antarcticus]|uniref:DUF6327 family protein n=1 Tax=Nonlabens antarcticus TaxID=392714 RepID=UPI0037427DF4
MNLKVYSSFEQIDRDLEILQLEKKIDYEKMKLDLTDVKESLSPSHIASNAWDNLSHNVLSFTHKLLGN